VVGLLYIALAPPAAEAQLPGAEPPSQILPPLPRPYQPEVQVAPRFRVFVRRIDVAGSTVFTPQELARITAPYLNRQLTAQDLEALRVELTRLYVDRGFVNSGVILPDQDVVDGVVTYNVIEGGASVEITGNRWFRTGYLKRRLDPGTPLNVNDLQRQIQLLLEDPRIRRLSADLKPGIRPGASVLDLRVEDQQPFRFQLDIDNYQHPSVGSVRGIVTAENVNLTGWGDVLTLRYGYAEGLQPLLDFRYAVPVTARDTTVSFQYRRNAYTVIEEPFSELDIESTSQIYTLGIRQPIYRTQRAQVALELVGERLSLETTLLGMPFTLVPGARDGESVDTAIRTAQEFIYRTQNQVLALRSRFSVGINALGATVHSDQNIPDGKFFAWLGQAQLVSRLPFLDSQIILRTDVQLTPDPLLLLEQVGVGGRYSVRGYRENFLVRDNAFLASAEIRVPVVRNVAVADYLELAPFYDYGRGWNALGDAPRSINSIDSVGMGLRWALTIPAGPVSVKPQFEIYFGWRLRPVRIVGEPDKFQDVIVERDWKGEKGKAGLHFQFLLSVF
jgi:hemolysin activation/secretion protein